MEADLDITSESIRDDYLGKKEKSMSLIDIFKDHNQKMAALIGTEFSKGTFDRYQTSLKHTVYFLQWKYEVQDTDIRKVDHTFIAEYDFYLRSIRKCANNSAVKYLKNFGKIIRIFLSSGWLSVDPFLNYKNKVKKVDWVFLTPEEIQLMADKQLATERLTQVRDIFLFCCFTGLAYVDVKNLRKIDVVTGIDGEQWIAIKRQKNRYSISHPLTPNGICDFKEV